MDRGPQEGTIDPVPRPRIDLAPEDRERLRAAWEAYRSSQRDVQRANRALEVELRRLRRRYPVAALARALKVTPAAIWKRLK